jgi:hypothetical protein
MIIHDGCGFSVEEAILHGAARVWVAAEAVVDAVALSRRNYRRLVRELGSTARWRLEEDATWFCGHEGPIRAEPSLPRDATYALLMVRGDAVCRVEFGE